MVRPPWIGWSRSVPSRGTLPLADSPNRIGVHGVPGRMGTRLIHLIRDDPGLTLGAAIGRPGHPSLGQDAGPLVGLEPLGIPLTDRLSTTVDAVVAFSEPGATLDVARACAEAATPLVVGTTGLSEAQRDELARLAERIPILVAPNTSRAVGVLMRLVAEAARSLGPADIEIIERHHRFKKDAPSGTALRLAEVAAAAAGVTRLVHGRVGATGERPRDEIGLHALRTGDNPGEHTVVFGLLGETLEITHRALNRDGFARGALDAAGPLIGRPPGLYAASDLFT